MTEQQSVMHSESLCDCGFMSESSYVQYGQLDRRVELLVLCIPEMFLALLQVLDRAIQQQLSGTKL